MAFGDQDWRVGPSRFEFKFKFELCWLHTCELGRHTRRACRVQCWAWWASSYSASGRVLHLLGPWIVRPILDYGPSGLGRVWFNPGPLI